MAFVITITNAGYQEIINAENTGTAPVEITEFAIGSGQYAPDRSQTALQNEIKRINTISGLVVADDTIHVTATDQSSDVYQVYEIGLYTEFGTLFAVYSQVGTEILSKTAQSDVLIAADIKFDNINASSITFGDTSFLNPDATVDVKGIAKLAVDTRIPKLSGGVLEFGRKYHLASNGPFTLPAFSSITAGDSLVLSKSTYNKPIINLDALDIDDGKKFLLTKQTGAQVLDSSFEYDLNTEITLVFNSTYIEVII